MKCISWFFNLLFHIFAVHISEASKNVICYYKEHNENRNINYQLLIEDIDPKLCTHIFVSTSITNVETGDFLPSGIKSRLTIANENGKAKEYGRLRARNPQVLLLLSVFGKGEGSSLFSKLMAKPRQRSSLARYLCKYVRDIDFDGIDINWQWPADWSRGSPHDKDNFAVFIKELKDFIANEKKESRKKALLLSVVLPPFQIMTTEGFRIDVIASEADLFQLMTMDYSLPTDAFISHHAPLHNLPNPDNSSEELNVASTVRYYLELGVDAEKMNLGIPLYGQSYILNSIYRHRIGEFAEDEGRPGFGTNVTGSLAHFEICSYTSYSGWTVEHPDETAMGPYAFKDNDWVAYDDSDIIEKKVQFAIDNDLGGIMLWSLDLDDFKGHCMKKFPLTKAVQHAVRTLNKTIILQLEDQLNITNIEDTTEQNKDAQKENESSSCRIVEIELEGDSVDSKDKYGRTRALIAAENGDLTTLKCLVQLGANLRLTDILGQTVLHAAADANKVEVLKYLADQPVSMNKGDDANQTALYLTVKKGYLESFKFLLRAGADPYRKSSDESTAMHVAASKGYLEIVRELYKAHKDMIDLEGIYTPLYYATGNCRFEVVKELVGKGAKILPEVMVKAVVSNCTSACVKTLRVLVDSGGDVNTMWEGFYYSKRLLYFAVTQNCSNKVEYLLNEGAEVPSSEILLYLSLAARAGENLLELFLNKGIDVNMVDSSSGKTVLHRVADDNDPLAVESLLNKGANISAKDNDGRTPLHSAANNNAKNAAEVLLNRGADANSKDSQNCTPLHLLTKSMRKSVPTIQLFLDRGADINAKDIDNKTPLDYAYPHDEFTRHVLIMNGARTGEET